MSKPIRLTSSASLLVLASLVAACAAPQGRSAVASASKPKGEVGLAMRALAAIEANDAVTAIPLAERAVEQTPEDAALRALLGNAYFAGGRFASAETAFKDSLAIDTNQPQVLLKLALVDIAQGKAGEALTFLDAGRDMLPVADYGLALALAGRPADAVAVLDPAARSRGADARLRQNLALAHALSGDWNQARIVAAQDVPADQVDARIQQWMQLAKPTARARDQIAALTGIAPAASDAGQPVRLALRRQESGTAVAQQAAPVPQAPVAVAEAAPPPAFVSASAEAAPAFDYAPPPPPPAPAVEVAPPPPPPPPAVVSVAAAAAMAPEAPAAFAAIAPKLDKPEVRRAVAPAKRPVARKAALRRGNSDAVVQLGSYRSPEYVTAAWSTLTKRYPALRNYLPMRARFDSPKGTFWRLSIQGFDSRGEAVSRCEQLKGRGGSCFVRSVAGDAPVQFASR